MAQSYTLLQLRTALIEECAIDGQTARHANTSLNERINRAIAELRSFVVSLGGRPWFQVLGAITAIPAAVANEDFIEIPFPTTAISITGVDAQVPNLTSGGGLSSLWGELDGAEFTERRKLNYAFSEPEGGVGWWTVKDLPEARASAAVTAGTIALFPRTLNGSYRVAFVEEWTNMTADTHVWSADPAHVTWALLTAAMPVLQRDNNKRGTLQTAMARLQRADAMIRQASKRKGPGRVVPKRAGGELF